MKIYRISRKDSGGYDTYDGFVIVASNAKHARAMAAAQADGTGKGPNEQEVWLNSQQSTIQSIGITPASTPAYVVLDSFNAG